MKSELRMGINGYQLLEEEDIASSAMDRSHQDSHLGNHQSSDLSNMSNIDRVDDNNNDENSSNGNDDVYKSLKTTGDAQFMSTSNVRYFFIIVHFW